MQAKTTYHALDRNILAVAAPSPSGWYAYIAVVEGRSHDAEMQGVLENGTALREEIARALFPQFEGKQYGN